MNWKKRIPVEESGRKIMFDMLEENLGEIIKVKERLEQINIQISDPENIQVK